jgi:hypothetical protein
VAAGGLAPPPPPPLASGANWLSVGAAAVLPDCPARPAMPSRVQARPWRLPNCPQPKPGPVGKNWWPRRRTWSSATPAMKAFLPAGGGGAALGDRFCPQVTFQSRLRRGQASPRRSMGRPDPFAAAVTVVIARDRTPIGRLGANTWALPACMGASTALCAVGRAAEVRASAPTTAAWALHTAWVAMMVAGRGNALGRRAGRGHRPQLLSPPARHAAVSACRASSALRAPSIPRSHEVTVQAAHRHPRCSCKLDCCPRSLSSPPRRCRP